MQIAYQFLICIIEIQETTDIIDSMRRGFSKRVLTRAKAAKPKTANIMFRLPSDVLDDFRKLCDREGVPMTKVLVALLREFLDDRQN